MLGFGVLGGGAAPEELGEDVAESHRRRNLSRRMTLAYAAPRLPA